MNLAPLFLLGAHLWAAGAVRSQFPAHAAVPALGQSLSGALSGYLSRPPAEALAGLRQTVTGTPDASQPLDAADAALYHLLTSEKTLKAHEARLTEAMGASEFAKLEQAAASLRQLSKTDAAVKKLMSVSYLASWALDRLYDATSEPGRLLAGARVGAPEGAVHALDDKTINDLELYADKTGLFALADRAETGLGSARLAYMLRHPSQDKAEVVSRQQAVAELMKSGETRRAADVALAPLRSGLDGLEHGLARGTKHGTTFMMANVIGAVLLGMAVLVPMALPMGGLLQAAAAVGQVVFVWIMLGGQPIQQVRGARVELGRYKHAFDAARAASAALKNSESPALRELGRRLDVDGSSNPKLAAAAASLKRMSLSPLMAIPDWALVWGGKTLWSLERKLLAAKPQVLEALGALAELDAYRALALYGEAHAEKGRAVSMPRLVDGPAKLLIEEGHNPYLALHGERSVPNDVSLHAGGERRNFAVLTGSNMGGKSTYLKMGAQLMLLAQIGSPVPAKVMDFTLLKLMSSIDIRDNIVEGKSLYDAETDRALAIVRAAEAAGHFLIMDEILQGTNPEESTAAQWALVRYMAKTDNLFTLATHNPNVTKLEGVEPGVFNLHVEEKVAPDGTMTFPHRILPGPAVSRNGLRTLKVKNFPPAVIEEAERVVTREQDPAKKPK